MFIKELLEEQARTNDTLGPEYDAIYDEDYLAGSKELQHPIIQVGSLDESSFTANGSLLTEQDEVNKALDMHKKKGSIGIFGREKLMQLEKVEMQLLEKQKSLVILTDVKLNFKDRVHKMLGKKSVDKN